MLYFDVSVVEHVDIQTIKKVNPSEPNSVSQRGFLFADENTSY